MNATQATKQANYRRGWRMGYSMAHCYREGTGPAPQISPGWNRDFSKGFRDGRGAARDGDPWRFDADLAEIKSAEARQ